MNGQLRDSLSELQRRRFINKENHPRRRIKISNAITHEVAYQSVDRASQTAARR
jgi:hypothetical protein